MPPRKSRLTLRTGCAALVLCASALSPRASAAAIGEGGWTGDFSIPAFDGPVTTCTVYLGRYVVGGDFRWASGDPVSNVAVWSGSEWSSLGPGLPANVRCLEPWGGDLIAGMDSYSPASAPVMRFDGITWSALGTNLHGQVDVLLVDGGSLYAAGQLFLVNSSSAYRVVRYDGIEWVPVGDTFDGRIRALAAYGGALYAAGDFLSAGQTTVSRIARFDGTSWLGLDGGTGPGSGLYVGALAVYEGRLIAGGYFDAMGGIAANGIAAWDGSAWSTMPGTPVDVHVRDFAVEGNLLHAAGLFQVPNEYATGIITFDGAVWGTPEGGPGWTVDAVAVGGGALLAVGNFADLVRPGSSIEHVRDVVVRDPEWRELESWKPTMRGLRGPSYTQINALYEYGGELYAGGVFEEAADPPAWRQTMGIARWDGTGWNAAGDLPWVSALATFGGKLVADLPTAQMVQAWDGTSWSQLGGTLSGYANRFATWNGRLCAVGSFNQSAAYGVAVLDGSTWGPLGDLGVASSSAVFGSAAVFSRDLYVGGHGISVPGEGTTNLVRWDGSQWHVVQDQPYPAVEALLSRADGLWVGGSYLSGITSVVSRWDGTGWTPVGEMTGRIWTLAELDGQVYAAGTCVIDGASFTLARWLENEARWEGIPDGPNAKVLTMAGHDHRLYLGGWFTRVGGRQTEALARWTPTPRPPQIPLTDLSWSAGPNPARDFIRFAVTLAHAGHLRVSVYDLRGARVAQPFDGELQAGTFEYPWDLRGGSGALLRSGVYYVKFETEGKTSSGRFVIVR